MRSRRAARSGAFLAALLLAATAVAVAFVTGARADDHLPPSAAVRIDGERDRINLQWATWWDRRAGRCAELLAEGTTRYGRATTISTRRKLGRLVFRSGVRPRGLELYDWRRVDRQGAPHGGGRIHVDLRRRRRHGDVVAWVARFHVRGERHHYMWVSANWRDTEGCPVQSAAWAFHLRGRRG